MQKTNLDKREWYPDVNMMTHIKKGKLPKKETMRKLKILDCRVKIHRRGLKKAKYMKKRRKKFFQHFLIQV